MKDISDLNKRKTQMLFKLTLIKLLSDPNTRLQQVSVWPTENNLHGMSFTYYSKDDNSKSTK